MTDKKEQNKETKHPNNPNIGRVGVRGRTPPNTKGDVHNPYINNKKH